MSQNLKIPFQNKLLVSSFEKTASTNKNYNSLPHNKEKDAAYIDFSTEQSSYSIDESLNKNATELNYSMSTNQLTFATNQLENGQCLIYHNESEMNSLLTYQPQTQQKSKQSQQIHTQLSDQADNYEQVEKGEQKFDYSQELYSLKNKIVQIQSIAQLEIVRLKQQLARQKQLRTKLQKRQSIVLKDAAVNTEKDLRDEEIQTLKTSILNHIDLNRQLLKKQINKNTADQMQNVIRHVRI